MFYDKNSTDQNKSKIPHLLVDEDFLIGDDDIDDDDDADADDDNDDPEAVELLVVC